jgi:sulfatase maturation enzyme AslB (radical SAM superfamily)
MGLLVEPYLHISKEALYNPLTDRTLEGHEAGYEALSRGQLPSPPLRDGLLSEGWLIDDAFPRDSRHFLKYVSLEGQTSCNQRCNFCPVSLGPRGEHIMPLKLYERIAAQLVSFPNLLGVFMNHYNEPTVNRYFIEHVEILTKYGLPVALLTNATGLTKKRVDMIRELGEVAYLCVNLSTLDPEEYERERGHDHLGLVLRNLDYLAEKPLGSRMEIVVLGCRQSYENLHMRFRDTPFVVKDAIIADRAGQMSSGGSVTEPIKHLAGCMQTGSRPLQHLHVNAYGDCLLCCQDYRGEYTAGNLHETPVIDVLEGLEMARLRRQTYGLEEAPEDFICRRCIYALKRD